MQINPFLQKINQENTDQHLQKDSDEEQLKDLE